MMSNESCVSIKEKEREDTWFITHISYILFVNNYIISDRSFLIISISIFRIDHVFLSWTHMLDPIIKRKKDKEFKYLTCGSSMWLLINIKEISITRALNFHILSLFIILIKRCDKKIKRDNRRVKREMKYQESERNWNRSTRPIKEMIPDSFGNINIYNMKS